MSTVQCDNYSICGRNAYEGLEVVSKSIPGGHTYCLCLTCAIGLKFMKEPTINDVYVSTNTVRSFRTQVKDIVNEAYNSATVYNQQLTICKECKQPQYKSIYDPQNIIQLALNINNNNFLCQKCIQPYL